MAGAYGPRASSSGLGQGSHVAGRAANIKGNATGEIEVEQGQQQGSTRAHGFKKTVKNRLYIEREPQFVQLAQCATSAAVKQQHVTILDSRFTPFFAQSTHCGFIRHRDTFLRV